MDFEDERLVELGEHALSGRGLVIVRHKFDGNTYYTNMFLDEARKLVSERSYATIWGHTNRNAVFYGVKELPELNGSDLRKVELTTGSITRELLQNRVGPMVVETDLSFLLTIGAKVLINTHCEVVGFSDGLFKSAEEAYTSLT